MAARGPGRRLRCRPAESPPPPPPSSPSSSSHPRGILESGGHDDDDGDDDDGEATDAEEENEEEKNAECDRELAPSGKSVRSDEAGGDGPGRRRFPTLIAPEKFDLAVACLDAAAVAAGPPPMRQRDRGATAAAASRRAIGGTQSKSEREDCALLSEEKERESELHWEGRAREAKRKKKREKENRRFSPVKTSLSPFLLLPEKRNKKYKIGSGLFIILRGDLQHKPSFEIGFSYLLS